MKNIDFNNIRLVNGSLNDGFEEFVCQLARKEDITDIKKFVRNGKPDGGVECYWILEDGSLIAWQAKYFCNAFDNSQYQQIDNSVKEALSAYPNLKKYIIAVPTDPSDAHISGRMSMKERINGYIDRWQKINANVTFEFWWSSDLIARLQIPSNQGLLRFWFGNNEFTDDNFSLFNKASILDLGNRYTPKLNIEVSSAQYFAVLSRGKSFKEFLNTELKKTESACQKIEKNEKCQEATERVIDVRESVKRIKDVDILGIGKIPIDDFLSSLMSLANTIQDIYYNLIEKDISQNINRESLNIYELSADILNVYNDLHQEIMKLVNDPVLILEGEAGVGKSHLLADIVEKRKNDKLDSLLLLGQKFTTDEEPFTQIMRMLNFDGSSEELLETLEAKAEISGHRLVVFIDAINEGHGLNIWPNCIRSFIESFRAHPWLGLVLSIRTSYVPAIIPRDEFGYDYCVRAIHRGFGANTRKAVLTYFKEYNILYPSVPLLNPEFRNPLFLHLFCEGMQKNSYHKIPDGIRGISSVIKLFFDGVEKSIRSHIRNSSSISVVEKAVHRYIKYLTENGCHELSVDEASEILSEISPRTFKEGELVDLLISEGVFSKNIFYDEDGGYVEGIYLSYERFENILQAEYIINNLKLDSVSLINYLKDIKRLDKVNGLFEALAILLPERRGQELFDVLPQFKEKGDVVNAVLSSLLWRDEKTIDSRLDSYFKQFYGNSRFMYRFVLTIIEISFNHGNYFNANYLHHILAPMKLADRDAVWIPILYQIYSGQDNIMEEIINWAWDESDKIHISDKSVELGVTLLAWLLASTNRKLRDTATKALIQLLHSRMNILISLFEKFKTVDDPYIQERLYCIAFGCAVRTTSKESLKEISLYVYSSIFDVKGEIYPHILLRDYAREIIEYAISIGVELDIALDKIRPPYNSKFEFDVVTEEDIMSILDKCGNYKDSPGMCGMVMSMLPEHSSLSYGDFGRYTFQSALSNWKIDAESLNYVAIKLIINKYGYSEDKHGVFDKVIGSGRGRTTTPNERIGKKYQWLAFHELLARVSDNFFKIEGAWSNNVVKYEGPWDPFVRDIDPTTLIHINELSPEDELKDNFWWSAEKYANWDMDIVDWLNADNDLPSVEPIIETKDSDGCEWLALECYPSWEEPHYDNGIYKRLWYQVRSCIVDETDFNRIYEWASKQDFGGRWMPENSERYEMFYREYYWSPAYHIYDSEGITKKELYDRNSEEFIGNIEITTIYYLWEAEEDHSKETAFSCLLPSKQLFDGVDMKFTDKQGIFSDDNGKVVCFDTSEVEKSKKYLLIRKDALLSYLKDNHKRILWYVLGERNIIGLHNYPENFPSWLVISGNYTLSGDGEVTGSLRTSHK